MGGRQVTPAVHATFSSRLHRVQRTGDSLAASKTSVDAESDTLHWYAYKVNAKADGSPAILGIFNTFPSTTGRNAHLAGDIPKAIDVKAEELLTATLGFDAVEVPASKIAQTAGNETGLVVGAQVIICVKAKSIDRVKRALSQFYEAVRDEEEMTLYWYLFQKDATTFGLWAAFYIVADMQLHLNGHGVLHMLDGVTGGLESIITATFDIRAANTHG